jgi:Rieske 2Fe-2S family protein
VDVHAERHLDRAPFPGCRSQEKTHHKGEVAYPNLLLSAAANTSRPSRSGRWRRITRASPASSCSIRTNRKGELSIPPTSSTSGTSSTRQDWQICESVQDGMRSRGFRGGFYAPMEDPSLDIRRYLERHLGDLSKVS